MVAVAAQLGFLIRTILANFDLQVITVPSTKFPVNWTFSSGVEVQNFLIEPISAIFYLQVSLILSTMFRFDWHFHSGEEVQNRFSNDDHFGFWIRTILAFFLSTNRHCTSYQVSSQLAFWFRRCSHQIFKMVAMAAILESASKRFSLCFFYIRSDNSYQVSGQLAFWFGNSS